MDLLSDNKTAIKQSSFATMVAVADASHCSAGNERSDAPHTPPPPGKVTSLDRHVATPIIRGPGVGAGVSLAPPWHRFLTDGHDHGGGGSVTHASARRKKAWSVVTRVGDSLYRHQRSLPSALFI